ncbi:unnamed protein product [Camellia sinensis]
MMMENIGLQGEIPTTLLGLPHLQTVVFRNNKLNGTLDVGSSFSSKLRLIDLQKNSIDSIAERLGLNFTFELILAENPFCTGAGASQNKYCTIEQYNPSYPTQTNNCTSTTCSLDKIPNPKYVCEYPYTVTIVFRALSFPYIGNSSIYISLKNSLMDSFQSLPMDSVCLGPNKSSKLGIIIGTAVSGSVLLLLSLLAGIYALCQKRRAEIADRQNDPFARNFTFEELRKYTNNFSEANGIGSGEYGKVYRGTLATRQMVAVKRAQHSSMQGVIEFESEIELLSRRKSRIKLDWMRRLQIALGSARGLQYLHELANTTIIHRDVKTSNILLDECLNAKVSDFGLSKMEAIGDSEKDHITTQVKGTMGYMDPEYYMTNQLTEKSDVYSFGVVMLELLTGRQPIEKGKYIVREVKQKMDMTKVGYNLHDILDIAVLGTTLGGLEKFVDLTMRCVEESGGKRPTMGEVVNEIENIMRIVGLNPNAESATTSAYFDGVCRGYSHPYSDESLLLYSGAFLLEPE